MRLSLVLAGVVAGSAVLAGVTPAVAATPMVVSWTTWLQAGPGAQTRIIDEIPGGWRVDVISCADGWCRVVSDRAEGYMREALLAPGPAVVPTPVPGGPCFPGEHQTPEQALPLRFCEGRR